MELAKPQCYPSTRRRLLAVPPSYSTAPYPLAAVAPSVDPPCEKVNEMNAEMMAADDQLSQLTQISTAHPQTAPSKDLKALMREQVARMRREMNLASEGYSRTSCSADSDRPHSIAQADHFMN